MAPLFVRKLLFCLSLLIIGCVGLSAKYIYQVKLSGIDAFPEIEKKTYQVARVLNLGQSDLGIQSLSALRDFLQEDILKIKEYLNSQGFYDVQVFTEVASNNHIDDVTIHVRLGERYLINKVLVVVNGDELERLPEEIKLTATKGSPSIHEKILEDKAALARYFKSSGHAFVENKDELVEINHDTLLVNITYALQISPKGKFGPLTLVGNQGVNTAYILKFLDWKTGELYDVRKLQETEKKLSETRLFDSVVIKPSGINSDGEYPLTLLLEEGKMRHVRLGGYITFNFGSTKTELGIVPKYIHDNLWGNNERFEINTILANVTQDLNIALQKPHFLVMNAVGNLFFSAERREYDAYQKSSLGLGGGMGYELFSHAKLDFGVGLEKYKLIKAVDQSEGAFSFLTFPLGAGYDNRDSPFFSQSGFQISGNWTPYLGSPVNLYRAFVRASAYVPIIWSNWILASWVSWEALYGSLFEESPIDKRIYLGGGHNLRGFPSQGVGEMIKIPNTEKKVPEGGLSGAAAGVESRMRIYGPVWTAVFLEGGQISKTTEVFAKTFSLSDLYWDAGLSIFYFTQFGPFRVDVAFPLGSNNDEWWQLHLSFGQAF